MASSISGFVVRPLLGSIVAAKGTRNAFESQKSYLDDRATFCSAITKLAPSGVGDINLARINFEVVGSMADLGR